VNSANPVKSLTKKTGNKSFTGDVDRLERIGVRARKISIYNEILILGTSLEFKELGDEEA